MAKQGQKEGEIMEEPIYESILKGKIEYYGETKAAYHFAAEEYARQYHEWMQSRQVSVSGSLPLPQHEAYQDLLMRIYKEFKSAEWVSPIVEEIKEHIVYPIQEDGQQ